MLSTIVDQNKLGTEFSIAFCRQMAIENTVLAILIRVRKAVVGGTTFLDKKGFSRTTFLDEYPFLAGSYFQFSPYFFMR